jgi:hypothetical protein
MAKIATLGISKNKWSSIMFLLIVLLISLALSNVDFLINKTIIATLPKI